MFQNIEAHDSPGSDIDDQDTKLVIVDSEEDDRKEGQEDADDLSSGISDESQDGKVDRNPGWRKKSQQKMEYGKRWIASKLVSASTGGCMVPLSVIESTYLADCKREGQEPLLLSVLARLLHQQFPEAGKCRLGPRGNQKIHYSKLSLKVSNPSQQSNSATTPLTPAADERAEKTPFEGSTSPQMQSDGKGPQPIMGGRGVEKKHCITGNAQSTSPSKPVLKDEDEGAAECQEAASRLNQVVKKVSSQGKRNLLLKTFAHSASCRNNPCTSLCLMFRRVRRHVVSARHPCQVMLIYSIILKLHVATCDANDCGLTACPALRASRQIKRGLDTEEKEEQQEEGFLQQPVAKKLNAQGSPLPVLLVRQPSPGSSPNSQPSPILLSPPPSANNHVIFLPVQPIRHDTRAC